MDFVVLGLLAVIVAALLAVIVITWHASRRPDALDELGVKQQYTEGFSQQKIEAFRELKERLQRQYAADSQDDDDDLWMSRLPLQAKDMLKYRLMQRAIGDMAALRKIDADARGYWRLFSKGMVTKTFWQSVVQAERELSQELEDVKREASSVEPGQDPQIIMSEAMQFILHYGDKLPSADFDNTSAADAIGDLMKHLPPPGHPANGLGPGGPPPGYPGGPPPGYPGGALPPGFPPGRGPPPGYPGGPPMPPVVTGGTSEDSSYTWKQDPEEIEISISVPNNAEKKQVKVVFKSKTLLVEHNGSNLVHGQLAGLCDPDGCTWTLSKGRVVVSLEKADPRPWPSLFLVKA